MKKFVMTLIRLTPNDEIEEVGVVDFERRQLK